MTTPPGRSTALTVNGRSVEVDDELDTPLLTVLRDTLGLVGTRFGCGQGLCGACFVRVEGPDGSAVLPSCQTPLGQVADGRVTTVEGISGGRGPHPVQRALVEHQAAQCGFCTAGIVVRAATLLDEESDLDEARVSEALERNLCRCGTQRRVIDAVLAAQERK